MSTSPIVWYDNLSTVFLNANHACHTCTKHVELDLQFVKERVLTNNLLVQHILLVEQPTDILTKQLSIFLFQFHKNKFNVICMPLSSKEMLGYQAHHNLL